MQFISKILNTLRQIISIIIFKLSGWSNTSRINMKDFKKAVIIGAPHTSYWDTFWSVLWLYSYLPFQKKYGLFKIEANKSFWGALYRSMGGIPIDRNKKEKEIKNKSTVSIISESLKNMEEGLICISPEGTRKLNNKWKTGFYYIALEAKVPIILGRLDYKLKECGLEKVIYPSGNFNEDIKIINEFYKNVQGKYPNKFSVHKLEEQITA
ncbi:MAG: acyltransferase [Bacteroidetes bacterium]|nr:acyltransferase [Bacteroidota bacterium]